MKETLILYKDWWEAIRSLPTDMQLAAYNAICVYAFEGEQPSDPMIAAMTALMRSAIDRDNKKYDAVCEKRRAAIKMRWDRMKAQEETSSSSVQTNTSDTSDTLDTKDTSDTNVFTSIQVIQKNTSITDNDNDNVNDNDNDNDIKEKNTKKESVCVLTKTEQLFEEFRKAYPGRKRGLQTELEAFKRKYKNWASIVPLLMPALERLIAYTEEAQRTEGWAPRYANLSTWLYQARWEDEMPQVKSSAVAKSATVASTTSDDDYEEEVDAFKSKN